jgi:hypothetical protein
MRSKPRGQSIHFCLLFVFVLLSWAFTPHPEVANDVDNTSVDQVLKLDEDRFVRIFKKTESSREHPGISDVFGPDPYRIRYIPTLDRYIILMRNSSNVVLCARDLKVLDSLPTSRSPTSSALAGRDTLFVAGELSSEIQGYEITPNGLKKSSTIKLDGVASVRDLVFDEKYNSLFLLDDFDRRLIQLRLEPGWRRSQKIPFRKESFPLGAGPWQVLLIKDHLIINQLLEHELLLLPLEEGNPDFKNASRIRQNGPFWSMAATLQNDRLLIAAGGVENRPFDRSVGEFGWIDSFLYIFDLKRYQDGHFRWSAQDRANPVRFRNVNLSELSIITPKALLFTQDENARLMLWVTGFGGEKLARFEIKGTRPRLDGSWEMVPGISDFVIQPGPLSPSGLFISSLLDCAIRIDLNSGKELREISWGSFCDQADSLESRLGELLFYTTLFTPENNAQGALSRFTCEACHFEGTMDGRTHFTGRDNIYATTKTLHGLGNNVPLFSRGGGESMASVVLAEFEVANQQRNDDFVIRVEDHPWLSKLGEVPEELTPLTLRRAFLAFFMNFWHRPNPSRLNKSELPPLERKGLKVFRDRCEDCHQAIPSTREQRNIPFDQWDAWLTTENRDLVWGAPFYTKTGITPYFDTAGTRVPSLRRVWKKYPLFTNGSSPTVQKVLERFRYKGMTVWHHLEEGSVAYPGAKGLSSEEIRALEALLRYF